MAEIRILPQRRSIRMPGYDYASAGAYFVTVCAHERRCLFGDVLDEKMAVNDIGRTVERCWLAIPGHFPDVELDEFVLMPNHLHGILVMATSVAATGDACVAPTEPHSPRPARRSWGRSSPLRRARSTDGKAHRARRCGNGTTTSMSFRDEHALNQIRQYIADNPRLWAEDTENPLAHIVR